MPPNRARYLAEIAECVRGYHSSVDEQVRLARERQQLREAPRRHGWPTVCVEGQLAREDALLLTCRLDQFDGQGAALVPLEPPVFVERVFTNRDFDTNVISFCNGTDPEIGVKRMYITSNIQPIPFSNSSAYSNEEVDRLFVEAVQAVETADRTALYQELQEILVADLPYFWLVETTSFRAHTAECTGFTASGHFAEGAWCDR